ncbi:MAG TPA: zinc finger domain-containing protein, partial [Patescibacteria group bacterium]|nr:zinc finger domain-containing protein [Patescibacteria group bacterium]
ASAARAGMLQEWESLLAVREVVTGALETQRREGKIGGALEASVTLRAAPAVAAMLSRRQDDLPALFIVSQVMVEPAPDLSTPSGVDVAVTTAPGSKCARCWRVLESVGADAELPVLCARCVAAVREIRGRTH